MKLGQLGGSFIRTGDGDHKMTLYEIDRFIENQQRSARNDAAIVPGSSLEDLDKTLLDGWLSYSRASSLGRGIAMSDEDLIVNRRVAALDEEGNTRLTVAGLMAMGKYPQKNFPRLNIVFTCYPMVKKGELDRAGKRFVDPANIDGPIPEMLLGALIAQRVDPVSTVCLGRVVVNVHFEHVQNLAELAFGKILLHPGTRELAHLLKNLYFGLCW